MNILCFTRKTPRGRRKFLNSHLEANYTPFCEEIHQTAAVYNSRTEKIKNLLNAKNLCSKKQVAKNFLLTFLEYIVSCFMLYAVVYYGHLVCTFIQRKFLLLSKFFLQKNFINVACHHKKYCNHEVNNKRMIKYRVIFIWIMI